MKEKQGDIGKTGLPGLLHLIYMRKDESAVLDVIKEPIKKRFFFRRGVPVGASSNILNEVLGRLLMQEGVITQQQYELSLESVLKEKKRHGEVLIGMGLLTPEALEDFLALQLKRRLFRLFDWNEGSYRYMKTDLPANIPSRPFHPASLILEGVSLGFFPAAALRDALADWLERKARLSFEGSPYRLEDFRLNLQEKRFAESLDGTRTVAEALDSSDLLRHRAEAIAFSLVVTGALGHEAVIPARPEFVLEEAKEAHAPEVPPDSKLNAELLFMRARTAISRGEFKAAIPLLRDITDINPTEGEYWAWLGWAVYNDDPSRIREAESLIKDSIDLNNDLDAAWFFLGMTSLAQGNTGWGKTALQNAIQKNPWNTEALSELKRLDLRLIYRDAPREFFSRFGFDEDPFAPVPRRAALTEVQSAALDTLLRAVRKKAGPVLLEGTSGTGKTTILLELLRRLSSDKVLASVVLKPAGREMDFIREINRGLGCPAEAPTVKEELLSLGMRVSQNRIQGGSTILVIDEAHRLTSGCLKLIQYLSRLKAVQILLAGDPALAERMGSPDFSELDGKISARVTLAALSKEETAGFIDSMLTGTRRLAGTPEAAFTIGIEEAEEIFESTGGNMGSIRREAAALLQRAFDEIEAAEAAAPPEEPPFVVTGSEPVIEQQEAAPEPETPEQQWPAADEQPMPEPPPEETALEVEEAAEEIAEVEPLSAGRDAWEEGPSSPEPAAQTPEPTPTGPPAAPEERPERAAHRPAAARPEPVPVSGVKGKAKRPAVRLVFWVVLMVLAGLAAGSVIGQYWFQPKVVQEAPAPVPVEPAPQPPEATGEGAPLDASLDMAPADGSI